MSRRDRVRQATFREIRSTARELLIEQGPAAVTINAIAREMGMSGPAVYRYYDSHDALVQAMSADFFGELTAAITAARDGHPSGEPAVRLFAMCWAMRTWAKAHPAEFAWIFAAPDTRTNPARPRNPGYLSAQNFEKPFRDEFAALWTAEPFPVPQVAELSPSLREQLDAYCAQIAGQLPPEVAHVFLSCWIRLYGLLCMEILHQLDFAFSDLTPVFTECLRDIGVLVGVDYQAIADRVRPAPPPAAGDDH